MIHREAEEVAVGLGAHRRHPPGIRQQADLAEVRTVGQGGRHLAVRHHDVDDALLDEVHLRADRTLLYYNVTCKGFAKLLFDLCVTSRLVSTVCDT